MVMQRHRVEACVHTTTGQQRRQAGGKPQAVAVLGEIQRFDAKAVARQKQLAAALVPDGKRKHALETRHALLPPGVVGLQDDFAVTFGKNE